MRKIAYLDAFSGISGDMCLGAVIDCGVDVAELRRGLDSIVAIRGEWELSVETVWKGVGRLRATHVTVTSLYDAASAADRDDRHDHSHAHGHGHAHDQDHVRDHAEERGGGDDDAAHAHSHSHGHGGPVGPQRNLATIVAMIESAEALPAAVKAQSVAVFEALANAEARAHGCALDDVHFHEVGAVDSIVDTVGAVLGFHLLGIAPGSLYCSALPLGHGRVWTQHGLMPVPVPATLELLRAGAIPTTPGPPGAAGELVTPTGASLVCALASVRASAPPKGFVVERVGVGAGTREYAKHPNVLRLLVGAVPEGEGEFSFIYRYILRESCSQFDSLPLTSLTISGAVPEGEGAGATGLSASSTTAPASAHTSAPARAPAPAAPARAAMRGHAAAAEAETTEQLALLEANIDDMSPELLGYACERLLALGALDVWLAPITMKKWRSAQTLAVLCRPAAEDTLRDAIFRETATLGVRHSCRARTSLARRFESVDTPWGRVGVKFGLLGGEVVNAKPEFEDCRRLALEHGVPCKLVAAAAAAVQLGAM